MISVCMATYNGEKYVVSQIKSILSQLGKDDELVVSDDGSTDKTVQLINALSDERIRLLHGGFHSPIRNFENAIKNAKGDIIFLSDQDDLWLPNKIELCIDALNIYDCIVTDCYICNGEGTIIKDSFYALNRTKKGKLYNLLIKSGYIGCCMAFRKVILSKVLPFPKDIPLHDMWIGNIAAFYYRLGWLPDKLIKYRRHGNNASCAAEKSEASFLKKLGYRWHTMKHLF